MSDFVACAVEYLKECCDRGSLKYEHRGNYNTYMDNAFSVINRNGMHGSAPPGDLKLPSLSEYPTLLYEMITTKYPIGFFVNTAWNEIIKSDLINESSFYESEFEFKNAKALVFYSSTFIVGPTLIFFHHNCEHQATQFKLIFV